MQIRNVANNANVDRLNESGERARRTERKADEAAATRAPDDARISSAGRETAAAVEQLAERARNDDGGRDALVEAAKQKLLDGKLDDAAVYDATANQIIDRGFQSV